MEYESGTILYRNDNCNNDGIDSSLNANKTETTKYSATISRNQNNLETKTPDCIPNKTLVCPEHGGRNYPSKYQCYQYKMLLRRIKSLLDEIDAIRKNETTGICEFCKRYNSIGRCKRCEILRNRDQVSQNIFIPRQLQEKQQHWLLKQQQHMQNQQLTNKNEIAEPTRWQHQQWEQQKQGQLKQDQLSPTMYGTKESGYSESKQQQQQTTQQQRFILWLSKVKQFLFSVLESEATHHKLFHNRDSGGSDDLTNLLNELKLPLNIREPYIKHFSPSLELLENLNESNDIYKEVVQKLRNEKHYYSVTSMEVMDCPSTCKYFAGRKLTDDSNENIAGQSIFKDTSKEKGKHKTLADLKIRDAKTKAIQPETDKKTKRISRELNYNSYKGQRNGNSNKRDKHEITEGDIKLTDDSNKNAAGQSIFKDTSKERGKHKSLADLKTRDAKTKAMHPQTEKKTTGISRELNDDSHKGQRNGNSNQRDKHEKTEGDISNKKDKRQEDMSNTRDKDVHQDNIAHKSNKRGSRQDGGGEKSHIKDKDNKKADKPTKEKNNTNKLTKEKESLNDIKKTMDGRKPPKEKETKEKENKTNHNAEDQMMAAMLKAQQAAREKKQKEVSEKVPLKPIPEIEELPPIKGKEPVEVDLIESDAKSESVMECNLHNVDPSKMIKNTELVPIKPRNEIESKSLQPVLFKVKQDFKDEGDDKISKSNITSIGTTASKSSKAKSEVETTESKSNKGVISYQLSNIEFIEKGWTLLPTTNIMRRMNVYKMEPAQPQYDWFKNHQNKRIITYGTGDKLAEIDGNGNGRWYYKNGRLALDYYSSQEMNSGHRYIVYSSGEKDAFGKKQPLTVLASFDYGGNGVVYDHYGNERLKYNQSEGVVIDSKIGASGHWKWHTLNDPPVLQPQFIDTYAKSDECLEWLLRSKTVDKLDKDSKQIKEPDLDMITIELENIVREKSNKLLQEFKPFQIKMKALKINDQFSLKVLDQSNIYLIFREGQKSMKLNLGMLLLSNEIVDTIAAELNQVATPYDYLPPKSQSIADIQNIVEKARHFGKVSGYNKKII